ncbi:MAG TPA: hypothetical protein VF678_10930 [bacterium]
MSALLALLPTLAHAGFTVHMPNVVKGEKEIEISLAGTRDSDKALDNNGVYNIALGYGVTNFWKTELEFEAEKPNGEKTDLSEVAWENTFQLTEPGQYWLNVGFFAEYAWPQHSGAHPDIKAGPILQMEIGRSIHTVNLFVEREVGTHAEHTVEMSYAWQSRFRMLEHLDAGFEIFGEPGEFGKPDALDDQQLIAGPVLYGAFKPSNHTKLVYEVGYLFGGTKASPDGTWKVNVEFEF